MKSIVKSIIFAATLFVCLISSAHVGHEHPPLAGHLSFKQNTLHIHASFPAAPIVGHESFLILEVKDAQTHRAVDLADDVDVVLWMPSMGHGSAPTQVERAIDSNGNLVIGTFNVRNVHFIMGGEWEIQVTLTDAEGAQETKSFKLTLDGSGHGGHH